MILIENDLKWNNNIYALAFYTYLTYMKVDIDVNDINFVGYNNGKYYKYHIDLNVNKTFYQILSTINSFEIAEESIDVSMLNVLILEKEIDIDKNKFDIIANIDDNKLIVDFIKNFSYNQINNFQKYFPRILKKIVENGDCVLSSFSILNKYEINELKSIYNTKIPYNQNRTIIDDFYKHLAKNGDKPFILFNKREYTYLDIEKESNKISNMLNSVGFNNGNGVIIYLPRSNTLVSTILGVFKCGGYYIPVDISSPIERLCNIQEDSKSNIIMTSDKNYSSLREYFKNTDVKVLNIADLNKYSECLNDEPHMVNKNDPCYMIYTSGTTGKPKGVLICHKNIANFVSNNIFEKETKNIAEPCMISVNKVGFDAFVGDILLSIALGFKIAIATEEELENSNLFCELVNSSKANIIQTTPTRLKLSIMDNNPHIIKKFKVIGCGGEKLSKELIREIYRYNENANIINLYGPSETTVWSTQSLVSAGQSGIGLPIQNTSCYVLNRFKKLLPRFEIGVLYIGGDGLGCYCFDKDAQKEKFVTVDGIDGVIYNTGDMVFIDDAGFINYSARVDFQVKINGVRIELSEIETVAKKIKNLKDCVAEVKNIDGVGKRIVLYYISDGVIDSEVFSNELKILPSAYIPSYYVKLDKFPLTSSNKINKKELPMPQINVNTIVNPKTQCEIDIFNICRKIRSCVDFGINNKLCEIGFDSLDMISIVSEIQNVGYDISANLSKLLDSSNTIEKMAKIIENKGTQNEKNNYPNILFNEYRNLYKCKTILLTGSSGFLGVHVLEKILSTTDSYVYCLCHKTNLASIYNKYFKKEIDESRVKVLYGDLYLDNFGLSDDDYELLTSVDSIINCAAYVKYFGDSSTFYNTNILSVKKLIKFAIKNKIVLNHISTLSVLGDEFKYIDEHCFYVGQDKAFENQYIKSKFGAEYEIFKNIYSGLNFRIIRIGRLAWRHTDGVFQFNKDSNEFYSTLKLFIELKKVPQSIVDEMLEISPVDYCADAIVKLVNQKYANGIFHLMNEKKVKIIDIINSLNKYGQDIEVVGDDTFISAFNGIEDGSLKKIIKICCFRNSNFVIENNDGIQNKITAKILHDENFNWPKLSDKYFELFLKNVLDCNN